MPRNRRIDKRTHRILILEHRHIDLHLGPPPTPDIPRQRREPRMRVCHPSSNKQTLRCIAISLAPRLGDGERRIGYPQSRVRSDRYGEFVLLEVTLGEFPTESHVLLDRDEVTE